MTPRYYDHLPVPSFISSGAVCKIFNPSYVEMSEKQLQLIGEAIKLELNMAELYLSFHNRFPEDAEFWRKIAVEEKYHAALLKSGEQVFLDSGVFPSELVSISIESLITANDLLKHIFKEDVDHLSRAAALNLALKLEESAGEKHFQHAIQQAEHPTKGIKLLQSLNEDDRSHADKIRSYMLQNGICVSDNE